MNLRKNPDTNNPNLIPIITSFFHEEYSYLWEINMKY
jgi:hypothetical protein